MRTTILLTLAAMLICCSSALAKTLFSDDFNDDTIAQGWTFYGDWEEKNGTLIAAVSGAKFGYAFPPLAEEYQSAPITIQAKVMITGTPWSRSGVAVRITKNDSPDAADGKPTGGIGYVLSTTENGPSDVRFLNEGVQWVPFKTPVRPGLDKWFWVQLTVDDQEALVGKVWMDGDKEPDEPDTVPTWSRGGAEVKPNRPKGIVGLVGKSLEAIGRGGATPIYDEVAVWDADGPSSASVSPGAKLATSWGSIREGM